MPRASAADAAATARRILEVAGAHFAEHGYAAASVDEIARAAQVTRGAVYHHYTSKPLLFAAVASAQQELVADAIMSATAGSGTAATPSSTRSPVARRRACCWSTDPPC